jgi:allantoinase
VTEGDLRIAMPALARMGAMLMIGGEISTANAERSPERLVLRVTAFAQRLRGGREYARYLEAHPKDAETQAIQRVLELCREYGTRTHILSLSSSDALTPIFRARAARLPVTVETSPHHLLFVAEEVPNGATAFACVPPIRDRLNRELLWGALSGGLIQMVASDHSPAPSGFRKSRDFLRAWPGIASLQFSLPVVWTIASARGHTLNQLAAWMCRTPARLAGAERKGEIDVGYDADLTIWNPDAEFTVEAAALVDSLGPSPYTGCRLNGLIDRVYLRGHLIHRRGPRVDPAMGRLLVRQSVSTARVT